MWLLLWFPEQDRYRIRALHHPSAITNIINLLSTLRDRERERERSTQQTEWDIDRCHSTTRLSVAHTHNHTLMFVARVHLSIRQEIHRQYKPRSCAARRYCGALSSSTRHKYLLGCMILSWTRSASSQRNHMTTPPPPPRTLHQLRWLSHTDGTCASFARGIFSFDVLTIVCSKVLTREQGGIRKAVWGTKL